MATLKRRIAQWLDSRVAARVVQLGVLLSLVIGLSATVQQNKLVHCQASYNQQAALAARERAQAYDKDRAAEDSMWQAFDKARTMPPEEARNYSLQAFQDFLKQRAEANKQRREHPLPKPPDQTCG